MLIAFWIAAVVAVAATVMVITRRHPMHALLYLVVSLLAVAVDFWLLGAPFVAALEVVVYAGAIMVLFVFAVMLLDLGRAGAGSKGRWLRPRSWIGPSLLAGVLLAEVLALLTGGAAVTPAEPLPPTAVGEVLFGPWLVAVELAGMLLLAGLVAAYHLARRLRPGEES